ncbi:MAG: hypothetical protein AAF633_01085 [Chloroflexota bacterium]
MALSDSLRLIGLLPDHVPEADMMTLVDSLLSTPIEAVAVEAATSNGVLMLEILLEMRSDEIVIGGVSKGVALPDGVDFELYSHSQIEMSLFTLDEALEHIKAFVGYGGRNLFFNGSLDEAGTIRTLFPTLNFWRYGDFSPAEAQAWMADGHYGLVPLLWHRPEQNMTQTISLGRAFRDIVMVDEN